MYSRRSGRHSRSIGGRDAGPSSRRLSERQDRRSLDGEEEPDRRTKKRKEHVSNGRSSRGHTHQASDEQEEEEKQEEEEGDEDESDGGVRGGNEEVQEDGDESDSGVWGVLPIKKLKVPDSARKVAEQLGNDDVKRRANDLARLALFSEYRRTALKREDITKKVLDKASARAFPVIFNRAQKVLRYTFGFEMVELRAKGTDNGQILDAYQTQVEAEGEEGESRARGAMSRSYIICSILPPNVVAKMTAPNPILSVPVNDVNGQVDGEAFDADGVMIDWQRSNGELGSIGLLFLVLSLILLNGRAISDDQLRSYLRRMSLDPHKTLPTAIQSDASKETHETGLTMDDYLNLLLKQSYLECSRSGVVSQGAMSMEASLGGKRVQARGRRSKGGEDGEAMMGEEYEWRWGSRAEAEISEVAVAKFVTEIYYDAEEQAREDQDADEQGRIEESTHANHKSREEQLLKHIENAVGSQLIS